MHRSKGVDKMHVCWHTSQHFQAVTLLKLQVGESLTGGMHSSLILACCVRVEAPVSAASFCSLLFAIHLLPLTQAAMSAPAVNTHDSSSLQP